jgi:hypothetical protein
MVTTCRRGDEMPCLAEFSRRPSTAGLKHLTRQDCDRCCVKVPKSPLAVLVLS